MKLTETSKNIIQKSQKIYSTTIDDIIVYYSFESKAATEPIIHKVVGNFSNKSHEKILESLKEKLKKFVYDYYQESFEEERKLTIALSRKEDFEFNFFTNIFLDLYGITPAFFHETLDERETNKLTKKSN